MPFCKVDENKIINKKVADDVAFASAWESSQDEYTLLSDIVRARKQLNLSQKELAKLSGCTQQEVSRLERHGGNASIHTLFKILHSMGYTLSLTRK